MGKNQHVVPRDGRWAVRGESKVSYHVVARYDGKWSVRRTGDARVVRVFDSREKATSFGRSIAKDARGEIIIHDSDGRVRSADSYGRDPYPPGRK